jgi:hypothetical protein
VSTHEDGVILGHTVLAADATAKEIGNTLLQVTFEATKGVCVYLGKARGRPEDVHLAI